jgi:hypothetical protein
LKERRSENKGWRKGIFFKKEEIFLAKTKFEKRDFLKRKF